MSRPATFVIAVWAFCAGTETAYLWPGSGGSVWWLGVAFVGLGLSVAVGVREGHKSGRKA